MESWKQPHSPMWEQAFERFCNELDEKDDLRSVMDQGTMQNLVEYAQSQSSALYGQNQTLSMQRLNPILRFFDDFAAILAFCFSANAKITALVWGSIRLMLTMCPDAQDTLHQILVMLEDISLSLPRFQHYEKTLPVDETFERALLDVYSEMICFCARTIKFLRSNPHSMLRRTAWDDRQGDFERTTKRIKRLSSTVEHEADLARMRAEEGKYGEILEVVKELQHSDANVYHVQRSHTYMPRAPSRHFLGRNSELDSIRQGFINRGPTSSTLRIVALSGMGGVGKTQIALEFASRHRKEYDDVFWIMSETPTSITKSCLDVLVGLNTVHSHHPKEEWDSAQALISFRQRLQTSDGKWLLILDNVEEIDDIRKMIPATDSGSILLTTRDFNKARALADVSIPVKPLDAVTSASMLLNTVGIPSDDETNLKTAEEICVELGGLPLAIAQMGGFIAQRRVPLGKFLPLYRRNAAQIDSRKVSSVDHEHSLSTIWQLVLEQLDPQSKLLQQVLAFLDPDSVSELLLSEGSSYISDNSFQFLQDELSLGDAEERLLELALMEKSSADATLSVHRLVQAAVLRKLTPVERQNVCAATVQMLTWGFPDTWSKDQGHQIATWTKSEICLPHVEHLLELSEEQSITLESPQSYAELLLRCGWYLYERERYTLARRFTKVAIDNFTLKNTNAYASALDLDGLISLDLAQPKPALKRFQQALSVRNDLFKADDPFIAFSLNNLALALTELGEDSLSEALQTHERAIEIRLKNAPDRIGNSYSNLASLLLRMGRPGEAERTLAKCPSLKDFSDETFLSTGNPRFSGDMVLLSRIRKAQGRRDDALRLASKALHFRKQLLGPGLKTCDSMHDVAVLLAQENKLASSTEILRALISDAEALIDGRAQLARACWTLSKGYTDSQKTSLARRFLDRAFALRVDLGVGTQGQTNDDDSFQRLCPWMLW